MNRSLAPIIPFPAGGQRTNADAALQASVRSAATLARTLADTLLANVQKTTALNVAAARALLQHARVQPPPSFVPRSEQWQAAWRSFEICATSAEQILGLCRGHVERSNQALWRSVEHVIDEMAAQGSGGHDALRASFDALQQTQQAYWRAAQEAQGALLLWMQRPAAQAAAPANDANDANDTRDAQGVNEAQHATH